MTRCIKPVWITQTKLLFKILYEEILTSRHTVSSLVHMYVSGDVRGVCFRREGEWRTGQKY